MIEIIIKSVFSSPTTLKLKEGEYIIGRDPSCQVVLTDPYVSKKHVRLFYRDGKWYVEDLGSRNGTYINGEDIRGRGAVEVKPGTEVILGLSVIVVK
uniref:FHA domain-containing protein n=1 Tax=Ignisphaera aggregans TaxID=334771 RepID=A0A7J2T859_9CREN